MPDLINGVPTHALLVHAVVVLVPLTALLVCAVALSAGARRRFGVLVPLLALVNLILVQLTVDAGEWLEGRVPNDDLVRRHTELGDTLLPWVIGLLVVATGIWALWRWRWRSRPGGGSDLAGGADRAGGRAMGSRSMMVRVVIALVAVAISIGAVVTVYRIGDAGAKAVWDGRLTTGG